RDPRRAQHRPRPARPPRRVATRARPPRPRRHRAPRDALDGGGPGALRPHRDHRRRARARPRHPGRARADRHGRDDRLVRGAGARRPRRAPRAQRRHDRPCRRPPRRRRGRRGRRAGRAGRARRPAGRPAAPARRGRVPGRRLPRPHHDPHGGDGMSTLVSPGTVAVLRTEARLFGREVGSLFWIVAFPVVLLCVMGFIPGYREPDPELGGLRVVDLYVPVTVLLSMIMAAILAMPPVVFAYREAGVLRRLRTTPVRPLTLLAAQVGLHGAAVAASTVLLLLVGSLAFGTPVPASPGWYLLAYVLALVVSFGLGAIVTAIAPNAR